MLSVEVEHTTRNASKKIRRAQRKRLEDSGDLGFSVAVENAPTDRGGLRASAFEPQWRGNVLVWGFSARHSKPQNYGTRAYWAPIDPLKKWAKRIGKDEGFAYYVQWKIAQEGIEAKHFANDGRDAQVRFLQSRGFSSYLDKEFR